MLIGGFIAILLTSWWWLGLIFFATGLVGVWQWYTWPRRHR